jgi:antitoxin ParD1/3/4
VAEGINVRFAGNLQHFIQERVDGGAGLYNSASEYIRDLVRRDYEREEQRKWQSLRNELRSGAIADESAFVPFDADSIISQAKARRKTSDK